MSYATRERIIATLPDGRLDIVIPDELGIAYLMHGLALPAHPWRGMGELYWLVQLQRKLSPLSLSPTGTATRKPDAVVRFCMAMRDGGLTRAAAVALIGEYTAGHYATSLEVVDADELPADRTYRKAWRRSPNGGPIWIDEEVADEIMWGSYERERDSRAA